MHHETLDLIAFKTEKYGFWNCSRVVKIKYLFLKDKSAIFVVWCGSPCEECQKQAKTIQLEPFKLHVL